MLESQIKKMTSIIAKMVRETQSLSSVSLNCVWFWIMRCKTTHMAWFNCSSGPCTAQTTCFLSLSFLYSVLTGVHRSLPYLTRLLISLTSLNHISRSHFITQLTHSLYSLASLTLLTRLTLTHASLTFTHSRHSLTPLTPPPPRGPVPPPPLSVCWPRRGPEEGASRADAD